MNKKAYLIIGAVVVLAAAAAVLYQTGFLQKFLQGQNQNPPSADKGVILFYGNGCPHCDEVEKFIQDNKIADKLEFTRMEVFDNQDNAANMVEKAKICKLDLTQLGVPFVWDGKNSKCVMGGPDVEKFFQDAAK